MLYTVEYTLQPLQPTKNPDFFAALSVIAYTVCTVPTLRLIWKRPEIFHEIWHRPEMFPVNNYQRLQQSNSANAKHDNCMFSL